MKGQFRRWPVLANGQVWQDKFLEPLKAQFRRNLPPARMFRHFRPPKREACLESGLRARIQRFQHFTGGSNLAENPQRVAGIGRLEHHVRELLGYLEGNAGALVHYAARRRRGEAISTAFVESSVNEIIAKRMNKKQQMRWNRATVQPFLTCEQRC